MAQNSLLQQGIAAYKAGQRDRAWDLLEEAVSADPDNLQAWLWLSGVVETDKDRRTCLEEVLRIDPTHPAARKGLALLDARATEPVQVVEPPLEGETQAEALPAAGSQDEADLRQTLLAEQETVIAQPPLATDLEYDVGQNLGQNLVLPEETPARPANTLESPELNPLPVVASGWDEPARLAEEPAKPSPARASSDRLALPADQAQATLKKKKGGGWVLWLVLSLLVGAVLCVVGVLILAAIGQNASLQPTRSPQEIAAGATATAEYEAAPLAVVKANIAAHNAESVSRYMATLHTEAPKYSKTADTLRDMYANYDLQSDLLNLKLVKITSTRAEVSFALVTRKIRGPAFRDNRIEGTFILRQQEGRWKLYNQDIDDVDYDTLFYETDMVY